VCESKPKTNANKKVMLMKVREKQPKKGRVNEKCKQINEGKPKAKGYVSS